MRVLVFAKAPVPGQVKTRLTPVLGSEGAARLHRRLVDRALENAFAAAPGRVELWCAPDRRHPFFRSRARRFGCDLGDQCGGDLGQRMHQAFGARGAGGFPALLLGSDAPLLTAERLREAASVLERGRPCVLIPALDGGYVLIGLAAPAPALFEDMPWGTASVLAVTRRRARSLGLDLTELAPCADIDRPEDLAGCPPDLLDRLPRGIADPKDK